MDERINQALAQIESDLRSIKSAREQVDSVVTASSQLKATVGTFVADVTKLSKQVEQLMNSIADKEKSNLADFKASLEALNTSCNEIVSSFNEKTSNATDKVKTEVEKLHREIEKLDEARNSLVSATQSVNTLKDSVKQLTNDLKNSRMVKRIL